MRRLQTLRLLLTWILSVQISTAVLVNQTIDDGLGDSLTGLKVQYLPETGDPLSAWKSQDTCNDCLVAPDRTRTYNSTWHSATTAIFENATATFRFHGTAIYIYFIIPNLPIDLPITSAVDCNFLVDGQVAGSYAHAPDRTLELQYNTLVYTNTSLSDAPHTFVIQVKRNSIIIFDYAQYTTNISLSSNTTPAQPGLPGPTSTTSIMNTAAATTMTTTTTSASSKSSAVVALTHHSTPAGAIAGSIVGGFVGIVLIVLGVISCRRRTRRNAIFDGSSNMPAGSGLRMKNEHATPSILQERAVLQRRPQETAALQGQPEGGNCSPGSTNKTAAVVDLDLNRDMNELLAKVQRLEPQRYSGSPGTVIPSTRENSAPPLNTRLWSIEKGEQIRAMVDKSAGMDVQNGPVHANSRPRLTAERLVRSLPPLPLLSIPPLSIRIPERQ